MTNTKGLSLKYSEAIKELTNKYTLSEPEEAVGIEIGY